MNTQNPANAPSRHDYLEELLELREMTWMELREKTLRVESPDELAELARALMSRDYNREHDGGSLAYAMSLLGYAAMAFLNETQTFARTTMMGADTDLLRRTRFKETPVHLTFLEDTMLPQYDPHGRLQGAIDSWRDVRRAAARAQIAQDETRQAQWEAKGLRGKAINCAAPQVRAFWATLAREDDDAPTFEDTAQL